MNEMPIQVCGVGRGGAERERERKLRICRREDWLQPATDMTALQFLAKLLKLMRSSYNTFNANQRLKHKYRKSKDCKWAREWGEESSRQARRTFTFCFENCNETNARNSGAASLNSSHKVKQKGTLRDKEAKHNKTKSNKEKETPKSEKKLSKYK